MSLVAIL